MPESQDQPFDKGGVVGRVFGAGAGENGKGLMAVVWISPATLDEFLKALGNPNSVDAVAKKLEDALDKLRKSGAAV